uniref:Uncharacterized protein n=1 Tax=Arundo donax TaxID=35708 RepID=A0A0A9CRM0_ARUDO
MNHEVGLWMSFALWYSHLDCPVISCQKSSLMKPDVSPSKLTLHLLLKPSIVLRSFQVRKCSCLKSPNVMLAEEDCKEHRNSMVRSLQPCSCINQKLPYPIALNTCSKSSSVLVLMRKFASYAWVCSYHRSLMEEYADCSRWLRKSICYSESNTRYGVAAGAEPSLLIISVEPKCAISMSWEDVCSCERCSIRPDELPLAA